MQNLEVGQIVEGKVKGIKSFGAFVELPNGDVGLVHISQVSDDYVENISDRLTEGQDVKVKILSYEEVDGKKKISLSIRQAVSPSNPYPSSGGFKRKDSQSGSKPHGRFNKNESQKSNNFEDMMAKFKRESDEKMSDLSQRLDGF